MGNNKKHDSFQITYGLQKKILIENEKYDFHYADIHSILVDGMITEKNFRLLKYPSQLKEDKVIGLIYFANAPDWPTYDCEPFDSAYQPYL